jgi:hypothetical protein
MNAVVKSGKAALTTALVLGAVAAPMSALVPTASAAPTTTPVPASTTVPTHQLVTNGTFDKGVTGWRTNQTYTTLATTTAAKEGAAAAVLTTRAGTNAVLNDVTNSVASTKKGTSYTASAWVRTNVPGLAGQLRLREVSAAGAKSGGTSFHLTDSAWHKVTLAYAAKADGAQLDLNVLAWNVQKNQRLFVDTVSLAAAAAPVVPAPVAPAPVVQAPAAVTTGLTLSNGAAVSSRGVPATGHALFGAAVGSNADPAAFESQVGKRLGVRRTYWGPTNTAAAIRNARYDLATGRLPWMSFKLPYSWDRMAAGEGDAWVKDLSTQLSNLPGPVWVAFYHEPEGKGPIGDWKRMQEHLGPIVRSIAPNAAFTVVLTGWNQLYGPDQYHLDAIWPNTKVDVAGFDIYNSYGLTINGKLRTVPTDLKGAYFEPIGAWAKSKGVAWGLAETAINDQAAADYPQLLGQTYADMVATGGVAFSYFNTTLNSASSWAITTAAKRAQFSSGIKSAPMFPQVR